MIKDNHDGLNSLLKQVAMEVATKIPESFNIAIPLNNRGEPLFNGSNENWELIYYRESSILQGSTDERDGWQIGRHIGLICGN